MANYSAISAAEKEPEKFVRAALIDKLDQNPHAIAEGATGAPRIQNAAFANNSISPFKLSYKTLSKSNVGFSTNVNLAPAIFNGWYYEGSNFIQAFFEFHWLPDFSNSQNMYSDLYIELPFVFKPRNSEMIIKGYSGNYNNAHWNDAVINFECNIVNNKSQIIISPMFVPNTGSDRWYTGSDLNNHIILRPTILVK